MSNAKIKKGKPVLPDIETIIQLGIDPKTGLPIRIGNSIQLKENIRKLLRIKDEQDAINRYVWHNLPKGLTSELIERILYYKGQGMFFFMEEEEKFYFLPYALDGTIDVYGRFMGVTPLPFGGTTKDDHAWIQGLTFTPKYEVVLPEDLREEDLTKSCVLLHDYCKQRSQTNIARQILQDPLIDVMSDLVPFMRTALLSGTGVQGMRVQNEDEQSNVKAASRSVNRAALEGEKWVPTVGSVEFQDFTAGNVLKSEEFLVAFQSLDNLRLGLYGIPNGGIFQKDSHMLQDEYNGNSSNFSLSLQDGLSIRQGFSDIVNSIWPLGMWCEVSEKVAGVDKNMDGELADEQDQSGEMHGNQPEEVVINEL